MSSQEITIIGAGATGLTTALLLQNKGYETTIISKHHPETLFKPDFVSSVPSASVIPHAVYGGSLLRTFNNSQKIFRRLHAKNFPGATIHTHYELFEEPTPQPWYRNLMDNFEEIELNEPKDDVVHLKPFKDIFGWMFSCFFMDRPIYFRALTEKYCNSGGTINIKELKAEDIAKIPSDLVINCSGLGSIDLFGDTKKRLSRGHLLHIPGAPMIRDQQRNPVSYNYTPTSYKSSEGTQQDVYFYPREDGWVLGGSRQEGFFDEEGNWQGDFTRNPVSFNGNSWIPAEIYEINRELIFNTFDIDLANLAEPRPVHSYRYIRSKDEGFRIEAEEVENKHIIHCTGVGGAGVTLSWGCAFEVLTLLNKSIGKGVPSLNKIVNQLPEFLTR